MSEVEKEIEKIIGGPIGTAYEHKEPGDYGLCYNGINLLDIFTKMLPNEHKCFIERNIAMHHYTSQSGLYNILESKKLWFTDSKFLNDTSEGIYIYGLIKEVFNEFDTTEDFIKFRNCVYSLLKFLNEDFYYDEDPASSRYIDTLIDKNDVPHFFICSFCDDNDVLNMWNYYTKSDNNIGVNIKFMANDFKQNIGNYLEYKPSSWLNIKSGTAIKVLYDAELQKRFLRIMIETAYSFWKVSRLYVPIAYNLVIFLSMFRFAFKHPAFKNENEIRLVICISNNIFNEELIHQDQTERSLFADFEPNKQWLVKSEKVKLRPDKDGFIPYIAIPFDKDNVKQITASPNMKNYETIRFLLKKLGYSDDIKVTRSTIPWRS